MHNRQRHDDAVDAALTHRGRRPGNKPICIDVDRPHLCIACCAAKALSEQNLQQSAVVAYSRNFGLGTGQALNLIPVGE